MPRVASEFPSHMPVGAFVLGGFVLFAGVDDATAASLGGAVSSVGVAAALATLLLVKGWQSHLGSAGLPTLAGLIALATGAGLLWRSSAGSGRRGMATVRRADAAASPPQRTVRLPEGVERHALLEELRRHFFDLQAAWDRGARDAMGRMTTPDMLDELCAASSADAGPARRSEFLSVHAELLMFEERGTSHLVCVEYSGMVREGPSREATPFREFWMLTRAADASSGWRLARHQGLL